MISEYPAHLDIESTNLCNLSCIMCPHRIMKRRQGYMRWPTFKTIIDQSRGKAKTSYLHQIGEPLLNPRIIDMINYTADAGIRTSISTNGTLLTAQVATKLCNSKLHELTLALDGVTAETYNRCRVGGDFNKVLLNMVNFIAVRQFLNRGPSIQLQMISMENNGHEIEELKEMFQRLLLPQDEILIKEYSRFAGFVPDFGGDTESLRVNCAKLTTHITIHWNGDVVICCRDFEGFTKVGNVNSRLISKIWRNSLYEKYRFQHEKQDFEGNKLCARC